jgi:hypothetical protein
MEQSKSIGERSSRKVTLFVDESKYGELKLTKTNCPVLLNPIPFFIKIKM